jgi:hypothetical protein
MQMLAHMYHHIYIHMDAYRRLGLHILNLTTSTYIIPKTMNRLRQLLDFSVFILFDINSQIWIMSMHITKVNSYLRII